MSFTAHKLYGPKGVGALFVRRGAPTVRLDPQITGGGQQAGLRSGTLNVPGIVGFARAMELAVGELPTEMLRVAELRNSLWDQLRANVAGIELCGPALDICQSDIHNPKSEIPLRLPANLNVAFPGIDGEALLMNMPRIAVSSGAACSSTDQGPSHVLLALGMSEDAARSTLRFGLGRFNAPDDVAVAVEDVSAAVTKLRAMA
jgi:cysteine desulfurase